MIDVSKTIQPKSDQLNADDLVGGAKTIKNQNYENSIKSGVIRKERNR